MRFVGTVQYDGWWSLLYTFVRYLLVNCILNERIRIIEMTWFLFDMIQNCGMNKKKSILFMVTVLYYAKFSF